MNAIIVRLKWCSGAAATALAVTIALLMGSSAAQAQICMQEVWQAHGNS